MRPHPSAVLVLLSSIGCGPGAAVTQAPEPGAAPTPSRSAQSPIVASSVETAPPPTESPTAPSAPVDSPAAEPAPAPAPVEASLSDLACESQGYGKALDKMWLDAHDELLACGELQTNATSFFLNISIWHAKPRYGGGPLPGHSAVIGTGGEEVSDAAVQCLEELAARIEEQLSPAKLPSRADCHARFERK